MQQLPVGVAGLVVAGILAAAMSTISSSINALASSMTHDLYAGLSGRHEKAHLLAVGRAFSLLWGVLLIGAALAFHLIGSQRDTPVVVLALSVASVTYGALLGALILSLGAQASAPGGAEPITEGRSAVIGTDIVRAAALSMPLMLIVVFAGRLAPHMPWLEPVARLAWPWYVPLGTLLMLLAAQLSRGWRKARQQALQTGR
ncbi:MAG: hypothetical protein JNJ71_15115 [Rubrivivax sp.]|nr:hypothetical protein [Rubrivivax sp.]